MKKFILTYILLYVAAGLLFSKEQYIFTQISQREGFASTVNCIYTEKDGDVWVGSPNGLYRFNGSTIQHHKNPLFEDQAIYSTGTDCNGNFWILTNKNLICRKAGTDVFSKEEIPGIDSHPFYCMCNDADGVWFGGVGKIFKYDFSTGKTSIFCNIPNWNSCSFR